MTRRDARTKARKKTETSSSPDRTLLSHLSLVSELQPAVDEECDEKHTDRGAPISRASAANGNLLGLSLSNKPFAALGRQTTGEKEGKARGSSFGPLESSRAPLRFVSLAFVGELAVADCCDLVRR